MRNRIASSPKIGDSLPVSAIEIGQFSTRLRRGNRLAVPDFCFPGILPRAAIAAIAGLILAAAPLAAREEVTRDVQKSATLRSGQRVTVDHRLGDVVIRTTTSTNATVAARIRVSAPNRAEAQRFADAIEVVVNESTLELAISTRYPDSERNRDVSYGVSYEITMPESSPLRVANRFGSVRVSGLKADADIRNGQGSIEFTDGRGTQHLENRFGPIEVRNNTGDVTIVNGNANVTVTEVTGRIDIRNQFGSVEVGRAGSSVKIDNRNANVNVDEVKGDANVINSFGRVSVSRTDGKVTIENRNGEIDVRDLRGFADLRTSFARIGASNLQSGVRASNRNGGVDFNNITGDVSAETSFARLTARTVNGNFTAENRNGAIEGRSIQGAVRALTSFDAVY